MSTVTHRTPSVSTTNSASYNGAAFTPAVGDLPVVAALLTDASIAAGAVFACTDNRGGTYSLARTPPETKANGDDTILVFVRDQLVTSAVSHTPTVTCTGDTASGAAIDVWTIDLMGRTGTSAVRQSAGRSNTVAGTTPTMTFGVAALTGNPIIGILGCATNPATITPPTNFTEDTDTGYATPTAGIETAHRSSGHTSTTVSFGNAATQWGATVIEFDTSIPASSTPPAASESSVGKAPGIAAAVAIAGVAAIASFVGKAPVVSAAVSVAPPAAHSTATAPSPVPGAGVAITPPAARATITAPAPAVGASAQSAPPAARAVARAMAPSITAGTSITASVAPPAAVETARGVAPGISLSASVQPPAASRQAIAPSPIVGASAVTIPPAASVAVVAPMPDIVAIILSGPPGRGTPTRGSLGTARRRLSSALRIRPSSGRGRLR